MTDFAKELLHVNLEDEMRQSYLDYAMSVIVGRALPDVRDGMKPVHRRILYSMLESSTTWNRPYVKCARVVGDVLGKYHPHGDTATYDALVRMAQDFSMRYMLVDGQGNFGSVDGDPPAAYRYTECRMTRLASELLSDIDKETVDFVPNYDGKEMEPTVLPARAPTLLINGSAGIAVGMATNIPPHNLSEVVNASIALIDNPELPDDDILEFVPGPDFPTAGIINGTEGIREAYRTGRGRVHIRGRTHVETDDNSGKQAIIVTELPYQVNKARFQEHIAVLVKEKKLEGIVGIFDESDKDGMRVVIDLRRGESAPVILNNLYKKTQLQSIFGINMVALLDGQPKLLNLRQILEAFIRHRREVVTRRTVYDLREARKRAHTLEGLAIALANLDPVIELIKTSSDPAKAKAGLIAGDWQPGVVTGLLERAVAGAGAKATRPDGLSEQYGLVDGVYKLSPEQAQAILDMRLQKLTGLEQEKIVGEYEQILEDIAELLSILEDPDKLLAVIRAELVDLVEQYGDARRTEINHQHADLTLEDLIPDEPVVVTLSHAGYIKSQPLDDYQAQRRGGRGKSATKTKDEDFVDQLFTADTHDTLLCFSSFGKCYWLKVYELPSGGRASRGKPIVNVLQLDDGEKINAVLPVREYPESKFLFMVTRSGVVKKTPLAAFSRPRANGIIAVDLREDDALVDVALTEGDAHVMLMADSGKAVRFAETDVRAMGRTATGVRGIRLTKDQNVISLLILSEQGAGGDVLTATENGYGKRTKPDDFPLHKRGGSGVIAMQCSDRNGRLVGAVQVIDEDQIMLITNGGTLVRTRVDEVSVLGRNTQGVRLIKVGKGEQLIGLARVMETDDEDDFEGEIDGEAENSDATDAEEAED